MMFEPITFKEPFFERIREYFPNVNWHIPTEKDIEEFNKDFENLFYSEIRREILERQKPRPKVKPLPIIVSDNFTIWVE